MSAQAPEPTPKLAALAATFAERDRVAGRIVQAVSQQGIESDHFRVKRAMPRVGGFRSFHTARRTICGLEAMLWSDAILPA